MGRIKRTIILVAILCVFLVAPTKSTADCDDVYISGIITDGQHYLSLVEKTREERTECALDYLKELWKAEVAEGKTVEDFRWWGDEAIRGIETLVGSPLQVRELTTLWKESVESGDTLQGFVAWSIEKLRAYCEKKQ